MCIDHPRDFTAKATTANDSGAVYTPDATSPDFTEEIVARNLPDGYQLGAFHFAANSSELPDLVGFGLGVDDETSSINLFHNPKNTNSSSWTKTEIQKLHWPVALDFADLTGNGHNDLIVGDRWGPGMWDLWDADTQDGGRVLWLKNPGDRNCTTHWEVKKIGNSTGMHRLKVGHFSQKEDIQVMAVPILAKSSDYTSPAPVVVYTPKYGSDRSKGPESWEEDIAFSKEFRLIHDLVVVHASGGGLDTVLVAGREGTCHLWYNEQKKGWEYSVIGTGLPEEPGNPYWGSGSVDFARVLDDSVGYVATCEALHGNVVSVYVKIGRAADHKGPESLKNGSLWTRIVVDQFGPLNERHTGTIHHVAKGDFDGSGVDSFLIACIGSPVGKPENQGVYLYKPVDIAQGKFARTKITNESASCNAVASYNVPGTLDAASISFYIPGFHTPAEPASVRVAANRKITH